MNHTRKVRIYNGIRRVNPKDDQWRDRGRWRYGRFCFTPDGVYHDVFYGAFEGRDRIAEMIRDYFHRDGCNFLGHTILSRTEQRDMCAMSSVMVEA